MSFRRTLSTLLSLAMLGSVALVSVSASASNPPSQTATVPSSAGKTVTRKWTGTIPPDVNPASDCKNATTEDDHFIDLKVPAGVYKDVTANITFTIKWEPVGGIEDTHDEILTVVNSSGREIGSSDGGSPSERVAATNLPGDKYKAIACGFANADPQPYTGIFKIHTLPANADDSIPAARARGLEVLVVGPCRSPARRGRATHQHQPLGWRGHVWPNGI